MKDSILILIILSFSFCTRPVSKVPLVALVDNSNPSMFIGTAIDLDESYVYWKGTKLLYTRSHEGKLKFESGYLEFKEGKITGGKFVVNVNSLKITDIPAHETTAIRNISGHLLEDLSATKYPSAEFIIESVEYSSPKEFTINGFLRIKDVNKRISASGKTTGNKDVAIYDASLIIDRFDWNIGEDNSWLEKKLVDAEVELKVHVVMETN